jgi:hypothetical protein
VSPSSSATYSATWLGIDGFNNSSLIQTGTEQDYYSGAAHYNAWWTTSVQHFAEQPIAQPVKAGDTITASVSQTNPATHLWTITIDDSSWAQPFTTTLTYTGAGTSAEWIVEAPGINGRTATLAHYSTTTLTSLTANGGSPSLVTGDGGVLVQRNIFRGQVVSIPSAPLNGNEFAIAYGSSAPPVP